ncbi:TfoX/Sxy family DNA transformation protein [Xenorhabdus griffiniae]|uniref:TfoX/Sxy family DNA transformation protein n=1 Tax=Xenorhabdus griffiniae TaxID=351672 RepID=A0ABY9XDK7_9GAMM|nr:TfoX/Sxy family DNA transformation protein [Xenorhabdus griffiniae]MBD1227351.1 TfoX/Sxy family DNA transformation protein [Xenorhabdus griffiniae]MBE8587552.1 TfoX/Sxy family DNA transformation protein [Xenorhabdus griffiniae]WMV71011.1 TfoX/Sxy family DNA transformation protein [Xenorhabdus griffiniae]WNH00687.1 TfoX/Sxy family DNA transformation protein [Xenorhabdus griffiniae]
MFLSGARFVQLQHGVSSLGKLKKKSQFGGIGLLIDDVLFAISSDGELYLRGNSHAEILFKAKGMEKFIYSKRGIPVTLRYYRVNESIWQDQTKLFEYVNLAYQYTMKEMINRQKIPLRLKDLPNLGIVLERQLWKVGISKVEELRRLGAKVTYLKLQQHRKKTNISLLLALAGAIEGCHVAVLPEKLRDELISWHSELLHYNSDNQP